MTPPRRPAATTGRPVGPTEPLHPQRPDHPPTIQRTRDGQRQCLARTDPLTGDIDVTMIYAAHDAFTRDLQRMASAWQRGQAFTPGTLAGWAMLTKQPHIHHTAEETSLWPKLRAAVSAPQEVAVLDAMEMEHAQLDAPLERVDTAIAAHDATSLDEGVHTLSAGLAAHSSAHRHPKIPDRRQTMRPPMKIAVTGATWRVGHHVVDVLEARGHDVVPMSRSADVPAASPNGSAAATRSPIRPCKYQQKSHERNSS